MKMFQYVIITIFYRLLHVRALLEDAPRIVIVGSGASGIAAASRLLQNGFDNVTILEAENRIGGRVHTTRLGDYWVDLGGQWVKGEEDNVVWELAWRLGVIEHANKNRTARFFNSRGFMMPETISNDLLNFFFNITNEQPPDEYSSRSTGEYWKPKFDERLESQSEITKAERKSLVEMFDLFRMAWDAGDSWYNVSAQYENIFCRGDQAMNWRDKGYNMVLDILMKKFPDPSKELPIVNKTILKAEVSEIDYNVPHGVIRVSTTNGFEYRAEHVIVTVSLGVLKVDYEKLFNPPLPETKIDAIKGLEIGHMAKIFLLYPEPWWGSDSFTFFNLYWTEEDKKEFENDPEKSWVLSIVTIVGVEHKPRVLSCWLTGPHAREMESIPEDIVFNQIKEIFHRFFGHTYDLNEPTSMLRSKWFTNKHFRGTWSYRSPETKRFGVKAIDLQEPIMYDGNPLVLFAGEATSTKHSATVNGAIGSGWREANRLIKLYGRQKSKLGRVNKKQEYSALAKIVVP